MSEQQVRVEGAEERGETERATGRREGVRNTSRASDLLFKHTITKGACGSHMYCVCVRASSPSSVHVLE